MADFTNKEDMLMNTFMYIKGSENTGLLRDTVDDLIDRLEKNEKVYLGANLSKGSIRNLVCNEK